MQEIQMFAKRISTFLSGVRYDRRGQDLVEYAAVGGFLAVAVAAFMPAVASGIHTSFGQISSAMAAAANACAPHHH
jgi:Flp pilus assembly pilin Flp